MEASRTRINNDKSFILFFNTKGNVKTYLAMILGFSTGNLLYKYLGMPLSDNFLKLSCWQQILQNLQGRLSSWAFRFLNLAGRTVLFKAVLQSMPIYQLSGMAAPKGACSKMVDISKSFWGGAQQARKWALISSPGLVKRKMEG